MFKSQHRWTITTKWNQLEVIRWERDWRSASLFGLILGIGSLIIVFFEPVSSRAIEPEEGKSATAILVLWAVCLIPMSFFGLFVKTRITFDARNRKIYQSLYLLLAWRTSRHKVEEATHLGIRETGSTVERPHFALMHCGAKRKMIILETHSFGDVFRAAVSISDHMGISVRTGQNGDLLYDPDREAIWKTRSVTKAQERVPIANEFPMMPEDCRIGLALEGNEVVMTLPPVGWGPRQKNILLGLIMCFPFLPLVILPVFLPGRFPLDEEMPDPYVRLLILPLVLASLVIASALGSSRVTEVLRFGSDHLVVVRKWPLYTSRIRIERNDWDLIRLIPQPRWFLDNYNVPLRFAVQINWESKVLTLNGVLFEEEATWLSEMIMRV